VSWNDFTRPLKGPPQPSQVSGLRTRTASVPTLISSPPPPPPSRVVGYDGDPGVRPWEELIEVAKLP
jgi:hypothetical protein